VTQIGIEPQMTQMAQIQKKPQIPQIKSKPQMTQMNADKPCDVTWGLRQRFRRQCKHVITLRVDLSLLAMQRVAPDGVTARAP
jgi:hypothetical protein